LNNRLRHDTDVFITLTEILKMQIKRCMSNTMERKSAKSPSSQQRAGLSIAETASRNTGNPGSEFIKIFHFFLILSKSEAKKNLG